VGKYSKELGLSSDNQCKACPTGQYTVSSGARKKQRKLQQEQATSRLLGRLQLRRKKLDKKNVVVVPKVKTPENELRNEIRNLLN
jgi:hypothetical protein